nr:retrovirus-related Pol polyprotein from transposon TNT 1-94 [Tanacetum cinerariifolium]
IQVAQKKFKKAFENADSSSRVELIPSKINSGPELHEMTPATHDTEVTASVLVVLISAPSSTSVDQDAPLPSTSQTSQVSSSHVNSTSAEKADHDIEVTHIVARLEAVRIFIAFAAHMNMIVFQIDVKTMFLNGFICEEVYINQLNEFVDGENLNHVYKLKKALYGLKQAPKAWYDLLSSFLLSQKFSKGIVDPTLFIRREGKDILLISQSPRGIFLNQSKYALESLKKYGIETSEQVDTPMVKKSKLDEDPKRKAVDPTRYHEMIGTLMYLTSSRPDLIFALCMCAWYQAKPTENHLHAVKRIFKYLRETINMGLCKWEGVDTLEGALFQPHEGRDILLFLKALNLLKKGLLVRREAMETFKRRRSMLRYRIQQLSKGSSEGSGIIPEDPDEPKDNSSSYSNSLSRSDDEDPTAQRTPLIDIDISMVTQKITSIPTPPITTDAPSIITAFPEINALTAVQLRVAKLEHDVSKLKKIDHSAAALPSLQSQVPIIQRSVKHVPESSKKPESKKSPEEILKIKKNMLRSKNAKTMHDNKTFNRILANHTLYHALMEALIADEKAMDKGVVDTVKDHKRKRDDDYDDDDDEDPSARLNQGKTTKRRRTKESESAKKTSTTKETFEGKASTKSSKTGKSATTKEPVEEPITEESMDDTTHYEGKDMAHDDDQVKDSSKPKTDKTVRQGWFTQAPRPPTPDPEGNKCRIVTDQPKQTWFNEMVSATKDPLSFNDLIATPIDFSKFVLNGLEIETYGRAD